MDTHLKDYVWMMELGGRVVKVPSDPASLTQAMVRGCKQVDPPASSGTTDKEKE